MPGPMPGPTSFVPIAASKPDTPEVVLVSRRIYGQHS
jgi:hypothetical protein